MFIFFGSIAFRMINKNVFLKHSYCFLRRESISEKLACDADPGFGELKFRRELLFAFEAARTRFAIAIATESKSTPLDRWRYYLDTAERMSRFVKRLRKTGLHMNLETENCMRALQTLRQLSDRDTALQFCRILGDIVTELE